MTKPIIAQKSSIPVEVETGVTYYWCACGKSNRQPFCDGSHDGDILPIAYTAEETKTLSFCACKHSKNPILCDGSHNQL